MPISCVYILYNVDGYYYIGQTKDLSRRLSHHKYNKTCSSKKLGLYWDCEVLEECAENDLRKAERYYYDFFYEISPEFVVNKYKPMRTNAEYCKNNPEKRKEYARTYRANNHENRMEIQRKYRAKKRLQNVN